MIEIMKRKWQNMPGNDRLIYMGIGICLATIIIYAYIWLPAQAARVRLEKEIQVKKAQLVTMRVQAEQVQALQEAVQLSHRNQSGLKTAIESSAKLHHMQSKINTLETDKDGAIHLIMPAVDFNQWLRWLDALQSEHHVRLSYCRVIHLQPDVKVEATLVAE